MACIVEILDEADPTDRALLQRSLLFPDACVPRRRCGRRPRRPQPGYRHLPGADLAVRRHAPPARRRDAGHQRRRARHRRLPGPAAAIDLPVGAPRGHPAAPRAGLRPHRLLAHQAANASMTGRAGPTARSSICRLGSVDEDLSVGQDLVSPGRQRLPPRRLRANGKVQEASRARCDLEATGPSGGNPPVELADDAVASRLGDTTERCPKCLDAERFPASVVRCALPRAVSPDGMLSVSISSLRLNPTNPSLSR
jgi:hypothetical protein